MIHYSVNMSEKAAGVVMRIRATESLRTSTGYYYAGTWPAELDSGDVEAVGKQSSWGSAAIQFLLRTRDGRVFSVRADKQEKPVEKWIRKIGKTIVPSWPSRDVGVSVVWSENL